MLPTIYEEIEYYKGHISSDIVLTRYLYIKDEVKYAILISILEKKTEQALFFAYELFHSGFKKELFDWLWEIYYHFFAVFNPTYETYMFKQWKKMSEATETKETKTIEETKENLVYAFVKNLLIRRYSTDIFLLLKHIEETDIPTCVLPKLKHIEVADKYELDCVALANYIYSLNF
jgi:hypothetical protein